MEWLIGAGGLGLAIGVHIAVMARWTGRMESKLQAVTERVETMSTSFDTDLRRLNEKVENDVHGRKAFVEMRERMVRIETIVEQLNQRLVASAPPRAA